MKADRNCLITLCVLPSWRTFLIPLKLYLVAQEPSLLGNAVQVTVPARAFNSEQTKYKFLLLLRVAPFLSLRTHSLSAE